MSPASTHRSPGSIRAWAACLLVVSVVACGGGGEASESESLAVILRLAYEKGDTLTYEYEVTGTAIVPDSTEASGTKERNFERKMRVEEVAIDITAGGHYMISQIYHLPQDSSHVARGWPDRMELLLELTAQGRILDVGGVETAKPIFGDMDFKSYFEQVQPVFPERPLKLGDSWTQQVKVVSPNSEPVVTSSTYVFEELVEEAGQSIAIIVFDGDIYLPVKYVESHGEEVETSEERIRSRGKIYFAHEKGVVERVETQSEATLTRVSLVDGEPVRRDIQIEQKSHLALVQE